MSDPIAPPILSEPTISLPPVLEPEPTAVLDQTPAPGTNVQDEIAPGILGPEEKMYRLEEPFMVLATQNPIEQEGTYPLPEAQLDRFLFELMVDYPTLDEEKRVVEQHSFTPLDRLQPILTRQEVLSYRNAIAQIP